MRLFRTGARWCRKPSWLAPSRDLKPVPLYLEHRGPVIGEVVPTSTERGIEVAGDYAGDLGGRDRFSIEFKTRAETMSRGLRIVSGATLHGLAALARPAYDGAVIETRRRLGPSLRASIPFGKKMDCRCPGGGCESIEFTDDAFTDVTEEVLATTGTLDKVVGRARLTPGRRGLGIDVDLLDVEAARDLVSLIGGGVSVFARTADRLGEIRHVGSLAERGFDAAGHQAPCFDTRCLVKPVAAGVAGLDPVVLDEAENRGGYGEGGAFECVTEATTGTSWTSKDETMAITSNTCPARWRSPDRRRHHRTHRAASDRPGSALRRPRPLGSRRTLLALTTAVIDGGFCQAVPGGSMTAILRASSLADLTQCGRPARPVSWGRTGCAVAG